MDTAFFRGSSYAVVKQALGAAWTLALVLHLWGGRPPPGAPAARD
jgi:hypothetical protein